MDFKMNDRNIKLVTIFLVFLILFIFISNFFDDDNEEIPAIVTDTDTLSDYREGLETDILNMLSLMQGVGSAEVIITLENGVENIYVTEENLTSDLSFDTKRTTTQTSTLLVEDINGRKQALIKMVIEPKIRGVVVVCDGGDNILIVARVTEAIKALLNISSTKIYVTN